ncbi:hypothetical protein [Robertmurraya andreesenii]|uniref:Type II secretory pathway pseudopilin PulG n=1 Tax=Anoxybacillus andreesenii TaxID=1325932 RepID=A0ABT9V642_9BACL|nr:hypothetical protein [Robertmurraya andreesenii]MDQ0156404.1 type II secretory pathway pseudopilin PulG [Robertmurraya andreesenii]
MLSNHKGFFLVELLLSLSMWILMTLSLLPLYIHVNKQSIDTQREITATHLMYDVLHVYLMEGIFEDREEVIKNGSYLINWEAGSESRPTRVCISYEDAFKEQQEKCERLE